MIDIPSFVLGIQDEPRTYLPPGSLPTPTDKSLTVYITRIPFDENFTLHVPKADGSTYTEELDTDETVEWFKVRGADLIAVDKVLTHVWNFYKGAVEIVNYKVPAVKDPRLEPRID